MEEKDQDRPTREEGQPGPYKPSVYANVFESFYERFRGVPLRYFDVFIGLCVAAFFLLLIVGVLQAKGIL